VQVARQVGGEIISADSRQLFREMSIATAKPSSAEQDGIPHHLIDFLRPDEHLTLAEYQRLAYASIEDCFQRGVQPILVGGTGLYLSAVVEGYAIPPVAPQDELRGRYLLTPLGDLVLSLRTRAPQVAESMDLCNRSRVIRALEVLEVLQDNSLQKDKRVTPSFSFEIVELVMQRSTLYQRIEARIERMIEGGVLDEVRYLGSMYGWDLPSMTTLGYKQLGAYLRGESTFDCSVELFKRDTRRYAKRQLTWIRHKLPSERTTIVLE
jgi:tRNA dimethylallyltransferase